MSTIVLLLNCFTELTLDLWLIHMPNVLLFALVFSLSLGPTYCRDEDIYTHTHMCTDSLTHYLYCYLSHMWQQVTLPKSNDQQTRFPSLLRIQHPFRLKEM